MLKTTSKASANLLLLSCSLLLWTPASSQLMKLDAPLSQLYQNGLKSLQQGDSLSAYQTIQSAHFFEPTDIDIAFHYHVLSVALDQANAIPLAQNWLTNNTNKIYHSRLNFELAKYFFRKQQIDAAIKAYKNISIDDLENNELALMQFQLGYLYFKKGDWDESTGYLLSIRQVQTSPYYTDANYYAGFVALQKKDFQLALKCFKIAEQSNAYKTLTPFYISQLYYFLGDVDAALKNTEQALLLKGQYYNDQLTQLMGHLLFEQKQYEKALPYLANFVQSQKQVAAQDLYQLSFCYFQSQQWNQAIQGFKQLANVEDSLGQNSMYLLATSYLKVNNKLGAKNAFLLCATKSQNLAQKEIALFNYAKLSIELKEYSAGLQSIEKFKLLYPNSLFFNESKSLYVTALAYSNDFNQAYEAYQKMDTLNEALLKLYPNILYGKAALSINDGQNEKAYELLNQVKNLPYNNHVLAQTHFWIGELAYKMARIDEAIEHLEKYISDPIEIGEITKNHAYYTLGYCYLKNNNYSKALQSFTIAADFNPYTESSAYQKDALVRLSDCQFMTKQYKQALKSYQKIIDLGWNFEDYANLQKAIIYGALGLNKEKLKILLNYDKDYSQSVYLSDARMELADTYTSKEQFKEAITPLSKVLTDDKASEFYPLAFYKLGIVYFNLNQNQEALQNFKSLFSAYPNAEETNNAIEYIRNIYVEEQQPEAYVQFMNDFGKPLSYNEQDSLIYKAAIIQYEDNKLTNSVIAFKKYLALYPEGRYQLNAMNFLAEMAYSKEEYDTAAVYFGKIAQKAPNPFVERAAIVAARLHYFNLKDYVGAEQYFKIVLEYATQQEQKNEAIKGLLRCQYKVENWVEASKTAQLILAEKNSASDDILMANMALYHQTILQQDTTNALQILNTVLKSNSSMFTAEAHYLKAFIYFNQQKYNLAELTAFEVIKKQAAYEFWVTKTYLLLGDIYLAQNDTFNAIATYKSIAENASIPSLQQIASDKLKAINETIKAQ
ncbi:MAG: tetratricopeptide repeat protein [Sediminibacterium sp.]